MSGYVWMFYFSMSVLVILWVVYIPLRIWMGIQAWNIRKKTKEKA